MALQIRRGPTADRTGVVFLEGEIIYDVDQKVVYIGDGVTPGGLPVSTYTDERARDAVGNILSGGTHTNISFAYVDNNDLPGTINATVNLSSYNGVISASGFKGDVLSSSDAVLVDSSTGTIPAEVVTGTFTGSVVGNASSATVASTVTLTATNNANASHFITFTDTATGDEAVRTDTSLTYNPSTNILTVGTVSGNLSGNVTGNVTGNILTTSITSPNGTDTVVVTPPLDLSSTLSVTGLASFDDAEFTGLVLFDTVPANPVTVTVTDLSGGNLGTQVLKLNVQPSNNLSSGPAINFTVGPNDGVTEPEENLAQVVAKKESTSGGIELKTWNGTAFVTGVGIIPDFVFLNQNKLVVNNTAFFTHSETFPAVTTDNNDITLYPESSRLVVYADVLPGIEAGVTSGTYNLGSPTEQFGSAYLSNGLVTSPPTTVNGKPGDVAGAIAFDGNYVYRCTAGYTTGSNPIWTRAPLTFTSW